MAWGWVARRPNSCPESPWPEKAGEQVGTSDRSLSWGSYIWSQPVGPGHRREVSAPGRDLRGVRLLQDLVLLLAHLPSPLLLVLSCPSKFLPSSLASSWFLHSKSLVPATSPTPSRSLVPKSELPESPLSLFSLAQFPLPSSCPHLSPSPLSSSPSLL